MTHIIGINAYHGDSAACLVSDGRLIAAAEEERFRRIKHWAGFPAESIRYCLSEAGIGLSDVSHVAINRDPGANILKKISFTIRKRPDLRLVIDRVKNARKWATVEEEFDINFPSDKFRGEVHNIEHHLSHMASSFLVSPFKEASILSVDGFGDFASASWGFGKGAEIDIEGRVYFPHSLGIFYQAITQYLGFLHYGDEYKVMGLAPYGEPGHLDKMRNILLLNESGEFRLNLDYFLHHSKKVDYEWTGGVPSVGSLYSEALPALLGPARKHGEEISQYHKDIARSAQAAYEEALFHIANRLHKSHGCDNLALAGGCAMNSVANGRLYRNTPFKKIYVQSAAGDAGGAIGAAFAVWHSVSKAPRSFVMEHSYWGPRFSDDDIRALLERKRAELKEQNCVIKELRDEPSLCASTAKAVSEGRVVGWFQGRMEWGPRALGCRSIIGDPRRADMKDILNLKIKRRESFRPFAPSVLGEEAPRWFESFDDVPFMMKVFQVRSEKRPLIPAVTHVDGSGRLQTVDERTNPRYYRLIKEFYGLTGVPMVLNTSFNENEPVVCTPHEALDCFLRTRMDLLVLNDFIISRV